MTSSIAPMAVFANATVLVLLAGAVASRRLSQVARLVIAIVAFTLAWLLAAAFEAGRAPEWTMFMGGSVIVVSIVVVIAALHLWTRGDGGGNPRDRGRPEDGGGPRRWPEAPQGGGGGDPSWWPEFQRQFALYVAECERKRRRPVASPDERSALRRRSALDAVPPGKRVVFVSTSATC